MTLAITKTAQTDNKSSLTFTDDRGRTCAGSFFGDGSGTVTDGAKWLVEAARKALGSRNVSAAIQQAIITGNAEVQ